MGRATWKNAAEILGEAVPKAADWSKFARLIEPGKVVTSVDGRMYRIASTVTGPDGLAVFKLADLQGKPVPVPSDFHPLTPAAAKFASWLRWVVAYNADFDAYVKHYIREAGLPIDERRNWAKWFQSNFFPYLRTQNSEIRDEAIHNQIWEVLGAQDKLGKFREKIKGFSPEVRRLPLEQQVTAYLAHLFRKYEISKANRWIEETYPSEEVPMEQGDEEGTESNILDAPEHATGAEAYQLVEAEMDVARFRGGFERWLLQRRKFSEEAVEKYLVLFDLVWDYLREHGERPPRRDLLPQWTARTGLTLASLKDYIKRFAELITLYKKLHAEEIGDVHPFINLIQKVVQERKETTPKKTGKGQPAIASLNIAAAELLGDAAVRDGLADHSVGPHT